MNEKVIEFLEDNGNRKAVIYFDDQKKEYNTLLYEGETLITSCNPGYSLKMHEDIAESFINRRSNPKLILG